MGAGRRVLNELSPLQGMTDLGMKKAALAAAQSSLKNERLDNHSFFDAARAVQVHGWRVNKQGTYVWDVEKWLPLLEAAYERMDAASRQKARPIMVSIYLDAGQYQRAEKYYDATPSSAYSAFDLADSIILLNKLRRWEELDLRMKVARAILSKKLPSEERSHLAAAMAHACWQRGDLEACKEYSSQVSYIDIHWDAALLLPVKAGLAHIGQQIRDLNQRIDAYEKSPDTELDLALRGFRKRQMKSARLVLQRISILIDRANKAGA